MEREKIIENLLTVLPSMIKRIMKKIPEIDIPKQQIELLNQIYSCNGETMSYYSNQMLIPKSNLTILADKLIKEGLVKRESHKDDRRIVNLVITDEGIEIIKNHNEISKKAIFEMFSSLNDEEILKLNKAMNEIKSVFDKL